MNALTTQTMTMSSLEVAELTGKDHSNVCRDIKNMVKQFREAGYEKANEGSDEYHRGERTQYKYLKPSTLEQINDHFRDDSDLNHLPLGISAEKDQRGYVARYLLDRSWSYTLVAGYRVDLRKAIIDRWESLETGKAHPSMAGQAKPMSSIDLIIESAKALKEIEARTLEQDKRLDALEKNRLPIPADASEEYVIPTILGKMFDPPKTAQAVNQSLKSSGLQYRVGGEWVATEEGKKWSKIFPTVLETGKAIYQVSWMRGVVEVLS